VLDRIDEILDAADGIMIARGDLGVEVPIEQIAVIQKRLMRLANVRVKPVITATQMLESMTDNRRPGLALDFNIDVANDMREILRMADRGELLADLTLELYCHCIKKYLGAYFAVLGRVKAVVFTGGIGVNASAVRKRCC
jgi:hypothetical protein